MLSEKFESVFAARSLQEQISDGKRREFGNLYPMSNGKLFVEQYSTVHAGVHDNNLVWIARPILIALIPDSAPSISFAAPPERSSSLRHRAP